MRALPGVGEVPGNRRGNGMRGYVWIGAALLAAPAWAEEPMPYWVTANLVARFNNSDTSEVPGSEKIDDKAYAYTFAYALPGADDKSVSTRRREYVALRLAQGKEEHQSGTAQYGQSGVSSIRSLEVVYGQRFFFTSGAQGGFGVGWYGGAASLRERWVSQCCGTTPEERTALTPVVGGEVYYKIDLARNVFVEPGTRFVFMRAKAGMFFFPFAINLGAQF